MILGLLENVAAEPLSFIDDGDDLAIIGEVTINRVSFKSLKHCSHNDFILIVYHGKTTNVFRLEKVTKVEKDETISFVGPIKLNLVNGFDVILQLGCGKTYEKDAMVNNKDSLVSLIHFNWNIFQGQLKSFLKFIKKYIDRKEKTDCYIKPSKYFKSIGLCKFNILNSHRDNTMKLNRIGENIIHPLLEIDMTDNNYNLLDLPQVI